MSAPPNETTIDVEFLSDTGPSGILSRLARVGLLLDDFQHRCFDPFRLRFIDYTVLRVLQLSGPPYQMSPTRLSEVVVRSTGGMTQILDRLERQSLVHRAPDPSDRRKVIVGLTKKGVNTVERVNAAYVARKAELLRDLTAAELEQIDDAIHSLLRVLTAERDEARGR